VRISWRIWSTIVSEILPTLDPSRKGSPGGREAAEITSVLGGDT